MSPGPVSETQANQSPSHDLLCGNVIVDIHSDAKEKPVSFIDYEYATPGPAAFDIANHFAEWAGYDCDHACVPAKAQRREFIKQYVASYRYHTISDAPMTVEIDFQKDIDTLLVQVDLFRGLPGFYVRIASNVRISGDTY